jgi:hypothetical protein
MAIEVRRRDTAGRGCRACRDPQTVPTSTAASAPSFEPVSQQTLPWREMDSNHRSRVRRPIFECRLGLIPRRPKSRRAREPAHDAWGASPRDRWFESCSLQRRVMCEPVSRGNSPSYVEKPRFPRVCGPGRAARSARDARDAATSCLWAVISLSGYIPVPHRR